MPKELCILFSIYDHRLFSKQFFGGFANSLNILFSYYLNFGMVTFNSSTPFTFFPKVLDAIAALASFVVQCLESIHSPDWSLCESLWKAAFDLGKAFIYSCSNWSHFSTIPIWWVFLLERRIGMYMCIFKINCDIFSKLHSSLHTWII